MRKSSIVFILMITFFQSQIFSYEKENSISSRHSIGINLEFSQELYSPQPYYGFPAGFGLFYQFTGPKSFPLLLGLDISGYGFSPLSTVYDTSFMLLPSLSIGFGFILPLFERSALGIFPVLKYGQYFRWFSFNDQRYMGSRPVLSAGIEIFLYTEKNLIFSIGFYYSYFFDNEAIHLLTYRNRIGYVF